VHAEVFKQPTIERRLGLFALKLSRERPGDADKAAPEMVKSPHRRPIGKCLASVKVLSRDHVDSCRARVRGILMLSARLQNRTMFVIAAAFPAASRGADAAGSR